MDIYIKLIIAGADVGPFDLYSDTNGFSDPFEIGVSRENLINGYVSNDPDGITQVKLVSKGNCTNSITIDITVVSTTTTTTSTSSTTTTTTTGVPTTTTTTTFPLPPYIHNGSISSASDSVGACALSCYGRSFWSVDVIFSNGSVVYNSVALEVFDGGGLWYLIDIVPVGFPGGPSCKALQINSSGVIIDNMTC